jgi:D-alanyl-D-alanine carboxypeptidase (penicillin-binding protein 5/6)
VIAGGQTGAGQRPARLLRQMVGLVFSFGLLLLGLLVSSAVAAAVSTLPGVPDPPRVSAAAAILMDWRTGQVLYAKDAYQPRAPASTTKILTALVAIESGGLGETVRVSPRAASTPGSSMGLAAGQEVTLGDLLWGMLLRSGNDACVAAAEHIAGTEGAFVEMANRRAAALGARQTHFRNAHGISVRNHYTTAFDLALMARYALGIPVFEVIVRTRETTLPMDGGQWAMHLRNTNSLLWTFAGADGVKTGTTSVAGMCLVASATRDGRRLLSVVLNSGDRYRDTAVLLDWGFRNYGTVCLARSGRVLATVRVRGGVNSEVGLVLKEDFWVSCPSWATASLGLEIHLAPPVRAPVGRGPVAGVADATLGEGVVVAANLVAGECVPRWTPGRALLRGFLPILRFLAGLGVG